MKLEYIKRVITEKMLVQSVDRSHSPFVLTGGDRVTEKSIYVHGLLINTPAVARYLFY